MPDQKHPRSRAAPRPRLMVAAGLGLVLLAGCSSGSVAARGPRLDSPTPSAAASPSPVASETAQIILQYRGFWTNVNAASRLPEAQREALLERYAAEAALRSLSAGIARERAKGRVFYGAERPRPRLKTVSVSGRPVALIDDCQDASGTGLQDARTGRHLTVGVSRNHVVVTMHQGADGIWRVVFVSYPKTPC